MVPPFAAIIITAVFPALSWAGGFNTAPTDPVYNVGPESAWFNPAGMTGVKTPAVAAGVGVAFPLMEFDSTIAAAGGDDGGNAGLVGVLPSFYAVAPVGEDFRVGFSVVSPFGSVNGTGVDYGSGFVGRYGAIEATITSIAFGPSVAYQMTESLSVGAGAIAMYTTFDERIAINTPGADGELHLDQLDGWSGQLYGGLLYQISPQTSVGLVYHSQSNVNISGDAVFSGLPVTLPTVDLEIEWNTPQSVQFGIQHAFSPSWIVGLNLVWEDWSVFSENRVEASFEGAAGRIAVFDRNWNDTFQGAVRLTHINGQNVYIAGLAYVPSVVDDDDRTIDLPLDDSFIISLAAARNESQNLTYGVGASIIMNGDAAVSQTAQGFQFAGQFDTNVIFAIGASLQWRY